jgi:hypothetical protein
VSREIIKMSLDMKIDEKVINLPIKESILYEILPSNIELLNYIDFKIESKEFLANCLISIFNSNVLETIYLGSANYDKNENLDNFNNIIINILNSNLSILKDEKVLSYILSDTLYYNNIKLMRYLINNIEEKHLINYFKNRGKEYVRHIGVILDSNVKLNTLLKILRICPESANYIIKDNYIFEHKSLIIHILYSYYYYIYDYAVFYESLKKVLEDNNLSINSVYRSNKINKLGYFPRGEINKNKDIFYMSLRIELKKLYNAITKNMISMYGHTNDIIEIVKDYTIKIVTKNEKFIEEMLRYYNIGNYTKLLINNSYDYRNNNERIESDFIKDNDLLKFYLVKRGNDLYLDSLGGKIIRNNRYSLSSLFLIG